MAKARSPQYPVIGLEEAIAKVQMVYDQDYQNKIPRKVVAEHMGFGSLNGKSLGVLSTLGKFGLLEGRGNETRVSDDALEIIAHDVGTTERIAAILVAAARPALFAEIDTKFAGGKGSDSAIRSYLMTQKFLPGAADTAIRAYRETKRLVEEETGGYNTSVEIGMAEEANMAGPATAQLSSPGPHAGLPAPPPVGGSPYKIELTGDRIRVSADVDLKGLAKLMKVLEAQKVFLELDADDTED